MPVVRPPKLSRSALAPLHRRVKLEQGVAIPIILVPARPHLLPQPQENLAPPRRALFHQLSLRHTRTKPHLRLDRLQYLRFLLYTAISIPPRPASTRGASPFVFVLCRGGTEVALPRKYRLPLLWVQKFMWQSVPLVQPLVSWNHGKWDVLHVARLARSRERGVTESWRYPTFDRALLRYWHRWLLSRDGFVEDFWKEFGGRRILSRMCWRFDWSAWVLKDHKGFFLTKEEARNGISAEEFVSATTGDYIILIFAVPPPPRTHPVTLDRSIRLFQACPTVAGGITLESRTKPRPLPEAKSLSKSEKAALMPEFTLFRSPEKQREQVSVSDKRQEQRERASRSQDRPSATVVTHPLGMSAWGMVQAPHCCTVQQRSSARKPAQTARKKTIACEDEDYQEDAHPVTRYAENREQEAQPETEVNTEIEEDSDLDDDDDDSLELLYPEQSSPEKGKAPPATKPLAHLESTSNSFSQLSLDSSAAPSASNPKQTTQLQLQVSRLASSPNWPTPRTHDVNPQPSGAFHGNFWTSSSTRSSRCGRWYAGDRAQAQEQKRLGLEQRVKAVVEDGVGTRWGHLSHLRTPISRAEDQPHRRSSSVAEQRSCAAAAASAPTFN
ncbi:hypothetical protein B0H14DRAFT_2611994 [Mycena olivaceomarginata]|nr:hypothetical protein B0H14DRAFT_2611994 [Mycena olivaceomarginata]